MPTLSELQKELLSWQQHNFPGRDSWEPVMGVSEEAGELSHAFLKRHQRIRGTAKQHSADMQDAIGDIIVYLADVCNEENFSLQNCLDLAWEEVKTRDWQKYREEAGE